MSGLDSIVAGIEDDIIPGLQYSLASKRGAKYVKQRNCVDVLPGDEQHLLRYVRAAIDPRGPGGQRLEHAGPEHGAGMSEN
jgi:hypothetical protein